MVLAKRTSRIGEKFNFLTIVSEEKGPHTIAVVRCDCGTVKRVRRSRVVSGETKSCGCLAKEVARKTIENTRKTRILTKEARLRMGGSSRFKPSHGMRDSPEYSVWRSMINRCENPKSPSYESHGARGIKVCDRWRGDFSNFFGDMGPRPSGAHSIDRIDNNGNYEHENCRWATATQQQRNKRTSTAITHDGKTLTAVEWSEITGIKAGTIASRARKGWDDSKCVSTI